MPFENDSKRLVMSRAVDALLVSVVGVPFTFGLLAKLMSKCSSIGVIFCSESIVCVLFDELRLFSVGVIDVAKAFRAKISNSVHFFVMSLEI